MGCLLKLTRDEDITVTQAREGSYPPRILNESTRIRMGSVQAMSECLSEHGFLLMRTPKTY